MAAPTRHSFRLIVLVLLLSGMFHTAVCRLYICDGEVLDTDRFEDNPKCFRMGDYPRSWRAARKYCRRQGGTVSSMDSNLADIRDLLDENGIQDVWSGIFIQEGRIVQDTAFTPIEVVYNPDRWNKTDAQTSLVDPCVRFHLEDCGPSLDGMLTETGSLTSSNQPSFLLNPSSNEELPPQLACPDAFTLEFTSCREELNFVCEIPATENLYWRRTGDGKLSLVAGLDLDLYISPSISSFSDSDEACRAKDPSGRAFRVKSPADLAIVTSFAENYFEFFGEAEPSQFESSLFWVNSTAKSGCNVLSLLQRNIAFTNGHVFSWTCEASLQSVCESDRIMPEQDDPEMRAIIRTPLIRQINQDVLLHSDVLRMIGGLGPLTREGRELEFNRFDLRIVCDLPFLTMDQAATVYSNGSVLYSRRGEEFYETRDLLYTVDLSLAERVSGSYDIIRSVASFRCEMNDLETTGITSSNPLFLRPTDLEIYSAHFHIFLTPPLLDWASIIFDSLWNKWPEAEEDGLEGGGSLEQGNPSAHFLYDLNLAFQFKGFSIIPLEFRPGASANETVLITYAYRKIPEADVDMSKKFSDVPSNKSLLVDLQRISTRALSLLLDRGVTKVEIHSIDWCWSTERVDKVTNRVYKLPDTRAPSVWKSSQFCARDNKPLVTIACEGDKRAGFKWGPTRHNPLCIYPIHKDNSSVSKDLQILAQENITSSNVNISVTELNEIIESVSTDEITATDVNYIADVLQKVTSTAGDLDPNIVDGVLEAVDTVSRVPKDVLRVGQQLGLAGNRIMRAADNLGGLVKLDRSASQERIVMKGLGLEVWDFGVGTPDSSLVVGIRMLSGGSEDTVTDEELVSQFATDDIVYDKTDAGIYLPTEFVKKYIGGNASSGARLALNVYKATSLYKDPSFGARRGRNFTLNSRVIGAQLLVNDTQITDLGGYRVKAIFEPSLHVVPSEERPNRTVCVFWDFLADRGEGGWSEEGCVYTRTREGRDVCDCDHLTNFAVLVSFYDQSELEHKEILGYITIVGLSLSIAGLALSMLSFIFIKKLRQSRPQQTLFHLSLALIMAWIVFLVGIERTSNHNGCIAVAALLHYLILASFMWMLMEALLQYLLFVKVMNSYFTNYMWKTAIPSWGLPIIPVAIILIIDTELYHGGEDYCWMDKEAFYFGFAIPVGLIILTNLVVFVLVTVSLCRRQDMSKHSTQKSNQTVVNIRASFICFSVLGLSWIFGFLAIENARLVFQYLFCITASLQGFIVFLMMTARDKQVRQFWAKRVFCCCPSLAKGDHSTTASSHSRSDPLKIPRAHSGKVKKDVTSFTNTSRNGSLSENGDNFDGLMGNQQSVIRPRVGSQAEGSFDNILISQKKESGYFA